MTTLEALAFNVAAGTALGLTSLFGFGVAVVHQHEYIAPRCAARPKSVIYNMASYSSPLLGWIPWTLNLSYETLLQGIPGTGTRQEGQSGSLLRCNLDAIVLLRFHALGLKVSAVATLLCCGLLPLYWTSECHSVQQQESQYDYYYNGNQATAEQEQNWRYDACASAANNLTNYERTTIANVPSFVPDQGDELVPAGGGYGVYHQNQTLVRLYAAVVTLWILTAYLLNLLKREWIELLALRRVYYLEANVWGERKQQLKETLFHDELLQKQQKEKQKGSKLKLTASPPHPSKPKRQKTHITVVENESSQLVDEEERGQEIEVERLTTEETISTKPSKAAKRQGRWPRRKNQKIDNDPNISKISMTTTTNKRYTLQQPHERHLVDRDPWIPHPEQRDTVSNIQLYSVLVGGLPSLPDFTNDSATVGNQTTSGAESNIHNKPKTNDNRMIDWQLALTAAFFDHCVPNQPGFSSSVAAVTLLPSSKAIAAAWSKWYKAAAQLRRLKFIRAQIAKRLHYFYYNFDDEDDDDADEDKDCSSNGVDQDEYNSTGENSKKSQQRRRRGSNLTDGASHSLGGVSANGYTLDDNNSLPRPIYQSSDQNQAYFRQVTGGNEFGAFLPAALAIPERPPDDDYGNNQNNCDGDYVTNSGDHNSLCNHSQDNNKNNREETEEQMLQALLDNQFGPEQTAIYSREVAQSAAACCPNGCWEGAVLHATIDELLELEREAAANVHRANVELYKARQQALYRQQDLHSTLPFQALDPNMAVDADPNNGGNNDGGRGQSRRASTTSTGVPATIQTSPKPSSSQAQQNPGAFDTNDLVRNNSMLSLPDILDVHPETWKAEVMVGDSSSLMMDHSASTNNSRSASSHRHHQQKTMTDHEQQAQLRNFLEKSQPSFGDDSSGKRMMRPPIVSRVKSAPMTRDRLPSDLTLEGELLFQKTAQQQRRESLQHGYTQRRMGSFPLPQTQAHWLPCNDRSFGMIEESSSSTSLGRKKMDKQQEKREKNNRSSTPTYKEDFDLQQTKRSGSSSTTDSASIEEKDEQQLDNVESGLESISTHDATMESNNNKIVTVEEVEPSKWEKVQSIVASTRKAMYFSRLSRRMLNSQNARSILPTHHEAISGIWRWPSFHDLLISAQSRAKAATQYITKQTEVMDLSRESSYAVVTFTSRQAALAARHCLADARGGTERWKTDEELPIPPLADAAAWDLCVCRNCCRPVAITIDSRQKNWRHYFSLVLLIAFYALSPFPLTLVASVMDPQTLQQAFPKFFEWADRNQEGTAELMSGFLQSLLWTVFFALCPVFFKMVANFGSNANSVANAELHALQYFWWFMVVSAFSSTLIANMVLFGFNEGNLGGEVRTVLRSIARAIPSTTAATWLNWMIFRTTVTLPALYLLQINSFFWDFLGFHCCSRLSRGGGPGPPPPYRLYVDSGVVLMCLLALSPASPLVAPAAFVYFLWCQPLLRRCCIFVYRPKFDGGGLRWPFIFDMIISSLLVGQVLLTIQMVLKQAVGPAMAAAGAMLPTLLSVMNMKKKFLRSFRDVALLQTSLLDGWDSHSKEWSTMEKREEFRRFLVDAHKAAYVPVCLASTNTKDHSEMFMTAEPAVVVPIETDIVRDLLHDYDEAHNERQTNNNNYHNDDNNESCAGQQQSQQSELCANSILATSNWNVMERRNQQYGATLRRAENTLTALRQRAPSRASSNGSIQPSSKRGSMDSGANRNGNSNNNIDSLLSTKTTVDNKNNEEDNDDYEYDAFQYSSVVRKERKRKQ
ncbi:hypothetical protein ACA910_019251 [Epithemia clementina (nom. ined.)]